MFLGALSPSCFWKSPFPPPLVFQILSLSFLFFSPLLSSSNSSHGHCWLVTRSWSCKAGGNGVVILTWIQYCTLRKNPQESALPHPGHTSVLLITCFAGSTFSRRARDRKQRSIGRGKGGEHLGRKETRHPEKQKRFRAQCPGGESKAEQHGRQGMTPTPRPSSLS